MKRLFLGCFAPGRENTKSDVTASGQRPSCEAGLCTVLPSPGSDEALRFRSLLAEAPCLLALVTIDDERAIFQNDLSLGYCANGEHYLNVLFSLQEEAVKQVIPVCMCMSTPNLTSMNFG